MSKYKIKKIQISLIDSANGFENRTVLFFNNFGDVVKEIQNELINGKVINKINDSQFYFYQYGHLNRPVKKVQVPSRQQPRHGKYGTRTDSIVTLLFYNNKGWLDSTITITYCSYMLQNIDEFFPPQRTVIIYRYETYKQLTVMRKSQRYIYHDRSTYSDLSKGYVELFSDNPGLIIRQISAVCEGEVVVADITDFHYIQKGNLTYTYQVSRAGKGCTPEAVLVNDTFARAFDPDKDPQDLKNASDPLGNPVSMTKPLFNEYGWLIYNEENHSSPAKKMKNILSISYSF